MRPGIAKSPSSGQLYFDVMDSGESEGEKESNCEIINYNFQYE